MEVNKKSQEQVAEVLEKTPEDLLNQANAKLNEIRAFRADIKESLTPIVEQLEKVREKFAGKGYSE